MRVIHTQQLGILPLIPLATAGANAGLTVASGAAGGGILANLLSKVGQFLSNFKGGGAAKTAATPCPTDAKVCPDGSSVVRAGANCEFPACPTITVNTETPFYQQPTFLIGVGAVVLIVVVLLMTGGKR